MNVQLETASALTAILASYLANGSKIRFLVGREATTCPVGQGRQLGTRLNRRSRNKAMRR